MTASRRFRTAATLTGAAFLIAAPGAYADNIATAAITKLHVQLIDLDPSDGIAPAVTFHGQPPSLVALTKVDGGDWVQTFTTGSQGDALGPLAVQAGSVSVSTSLLAGNLLAGTGPGVLALSTVGGLNAGGWAYGLAIQGQFTLTAKTRLVITADASVNVSGDAGTTAAAYGQLELYDLDFQNRSDSTLQASLYPDSASPFVPAPGILQASFANGTGTSMEGLMYARASAYVTTAVPEPASYALMLVGLGLLGHRARRKRV